MSYHFWNTFIDEWRNKDSFTATTPISINGWTNPNILKLLNSDAPTDYSLQYLPEPWWGNSGNQPLQSVVINYNPFTGGGNQFHGLCAPNLFGNTDYSSFIDNEVSGRASILPGTNSWHNIKRAQPIFNALIASGISLVFPRLENHLSIELIPWHSPTPVNLIFSQYVTNNLQSIFDNCLLFAANESRRIANGKLNCKVILRMNKKNTINLLDQFVKSNICNYSMIVEGNVPHPPYSNGSGSYYKFEIIHNSFKDIEFICIWKPKGGWTRNDFPKQPQLDWIFKKAII